MQPGFRRRIGAGAAILARNAVCARPLAAGLLAASLLAGAARAQTIQVACGQAILTDAESGSVLFERNADERASPASVAKVMTAELLFRELKAGKVSLKDEFSVSEYAWRTGGAPSRGSTMFAALNSRIPVEDLLRGMVIVSGNDAAIVIGENLAGSDAAFAERMNARAKELGMKDSSFANSWGGPDPRQKTSVRDLAALGAHIVSAYPEYYKYFGEKEFVWNKIAQPNRNPLLSMGVGADGLKTGNIEESGYAILGSAVEDGRRLFVALNACKSASQRAEDARKLLLWGFRAFEARRLYDAGEIVGGARVFGGALSEAPLTSPAPIKLFLPRGANEKLTGKIVYDGPLAPPIHKGDKLARLVVLRGPNVALDVPLYAAEDVAQGDLPRRALDGALELARQLFARYATRK